MESPASDASDKPSGLETESNFDCCPEKAGAVLFDSLLIFQISGQLMDMDEQDESAPYRVIDDNNSRLSWIAYRFMIICGLPASLPLLP